MARRWARVGRLRQVPPPSGGTGCTGIATGHCALAPPSPSTGRRSIPPAPVRIDQRVVMAAHLRVSRKIAPSTFKLGSGPPPDWSLCPGRAPVVRYRRWNFHRTSEFVHRDPASVDNALTRSFVSVAVRTCPAFHPHWELIMLRSLVRFQLAPPQKRRSGTM